MEIQRLNQTQFNKFCDMIYQECGIRIDSRKVMLLSNRIRRRLQAGSFTSFDEYYRHLRSDSGADEFQCFLDVVTTNETFFIRTDKHFDWLRDRLIPELVSDHRDGKRAASLRIWSAGCSTGAEPYSIAMSLVENSYRLPDWSIKILGTDVSQEVLSIAREGKFKTRIMDSVSDKQRRRFFRFLPESNLWEVRPEIRQLVEFKHQNLIQAPPEIKFDCIFVCNVLIYFDQESKQRVVENLLSALKDGGYLVVGPSEGISGMLGSLKKVVPLVYQKVDASQRSIERVTERDRRP